MRSPSQTRTFSTKRLVALERTGRYDEALAEFGEGFIDDDFVPVLEGGTASENAEARLRFGALIGFYGNKHGIAGGQERSKDLLTSARKVFSDLGDLEKVVECENYIAIAYWRTGEFREALTWVEQALERTVPISSRPRLYAEVTKSMVLFSAGRVEENIDHCLRVEKDMRRYGDNLLNGSLCTNVALSYKRLSRNHEAMQYLKLARQFHERSKHWPYLGTVYNNLAQLYKAEGKFAEAHDAAESAIRIYRRIKDRTREGSSCDTKAQIYLVEGKLSDGLKMADKSISILGKLDASADLAESYLTRAKLLLFSDRFSDAIFSLIESVGMTRLQNGDAAAEAVINDFEAALKEKHDQAIKPQPISSDDLELTLPASLAAYPDYKGIWIHTDRLAKAGVPRGSLAVVVPGAVARGDLIAISEIRTGTVYCGSYDAEFGIICLEAPDSDPELFDEKDVQIIGKIVGVCRNGKNSSGNMVVEAL